MSVIKSWKSLEHPASFSSAEYLSKSLKKPQKKVKKELEKSILFQAHRDLKENFKKRSILATYENEKWEADLADMGGRIPPELSGEIVKPGRRKQLQMLVVVDLFTHKIYAEGLKSKEGKEVVRGLTLIEKAAGSPPQRLQSDEGKDFKNKTVKEYCKQKNILQTFASGLHKARNAERAVRSLKRIIMASVQTDSWPHNKTWLDVPKIAAAQLRDRFNRTIGCRPNDVSLNPTLQDELRKKEMDKANISDAKKYSVDEKKIYAGGEFKEQGKTFSINDPVLIPISKQRRAEIRDKEYMMHYKLLPMTICDIFHGRSPAIYAVKNPRTGKRLKRRYYAVELKKVSFPNNVKLSKITSYEIKNGEIWYKIDGQEEPLKLR